MKRIYFDYAATTPIAPNVFKAMLPYLKEGYGNPSSIHSFGQKTRGAIDESRETIAEFLNSSPSEIYFTGSATEANNTVIFGIKRANKDKKIHIITSKIEHEAVLNPLEELEKEGVEVTYLKVNREGLIDILDLEKNIKDNTVLVSIIYANNEIGTIEDIKGIGKKLREINENRKEKIYFHTDAVQAVNYLQCDVNDLGVDLLTLSSHKIYGPKGIGALYIRKGTKIKPLIFGGGQEQGMRSGTENVSSIVGFAAAIKEVKKNRAKANTIKRLRDKLIKGILKDIPYSMLNGSKDKRLINNINVSFKGAEGESIVISLDQKGIAASTGSACSSKSLEPSHVLLSLGLSHEEAHGSLRITLGRYTKELDINYLLKVLPGIIKNLRIISGFTKE